MLGVFRADVDDVAYQVGTRPGAWVAAQAARRARLIWLGIGIFFLVAGLMLALAVTGSASSGRRCFSVR